MSRSVTIPMSRLLSPQTGINSTSRVFIVRAASWRVASGNTRSTFGDMMNLTSMIGLPPPGKETRSVAAPSGHGPILSTFSATA